MAEGAAALRACRLCVQVARVSGAGISLVTSAGNRGVVCATDAIAARLEDLQLTLGEGPCVDAIRTGDPVLVADVDEPGLAVERWPGFLEGAGAAGVRAVFALPLRIGAIGVGVLDLYRLSPGDLETGELAAALVAADAAAVALLDLDTGHDAFLDDRSVGASYLMEVHQATGMVKVQAGVSIDEAFLLLRAKAFATGRPIADLARDVIDRRLGFTMEVS
jgi:hypothetical protein